MSSMEIIPEVLQMCFFGPYAHEGSSGNIFKYETEMFVD